MTWSSGVLSPFISVLSDQIQAQNWALRRVENLKGRRHSAEEESLDMFLHGFDSARLSEYTWIFHFRTLLKLFGIEAPAYVSRNEYLIWKFVPIKVVLISRLKYQRSGHGQCELSHTFFQLHATDTSVADFLQIYPTTIAKTAEELRAQAVLGQLEDSLDAVQCAHQKEILAGELIDAAITSLQAGETVSKMVLIKVFSLILSGHMESNRAMNSLFRKTWRHIPTAGPLRQPQGQLASRSVSGWKEPRINYRGD